MIQCLKKTKTENPLVLIDEVCNLFSLIQGSCTVKPALNGTSI
jgi:ATP-dependent Lon protease